jgi:hypothetical protein
MTNPKVLIIGHGRHGKDTVAEVMRDYHGYKFTSSSLFCAEFVRFYMAERGLKYATLDDCYADRHNHRDVWFKAVTEYNREDPTRVATEMQASGYSLYVGMRSRREFEACMTAGTFDHVIWVDRSEHLPPEPPESMELQPSDAHFVIRNNYTLRDLWHEIDFLQNKELQYGL